MDELLQRVAEIRGMPASLIERSAQARAEKEGVTVEAVLQEWAGEAGAPAAAPQEAAPQAAPAPAPAEAAPEATPAAAPAEITTDHLVQLAADAKRMPPKLILTSATARAEHSKSSLAEVLADWAGVDLEELKQQAASTESAEPETESPKADVPIEPAATEPVVAAAAVATGALTMDELLEKVAEVKGMPAALAQRSAEARSKKTGEPVESVLAEWAGVDASAVSPTPTVVTDAPEPTAEASPVEEPEETSEPEIIEASDAEVAEPADEDTEPVVRGGYPRWLAAAFILIPLLAVTYILVAPNGPDCGTAGQLHIDEATGLAVNCDGTEYGISEVDFYAEGAGVYGQCVACHSADGSGGAGPAFSGGAVLATFPAGSCDQQIEWIRLGTSGWPDPTYGATEKPVGGGGLMPAFAALSDEDISAVALYERVEFGGQSLDEALTDCGLAAPEDGETAEASGS